MNLAVLQVFFIFGLIFSHIIHSLIPPHTTTCYLYDYFLKFVERYHCSKFSVLGSFLISNFSRVIYSLVILSWKLHLCEGIQDLA